MVGMHSSVLVGLDVFLCLNQSYSKYDWCEITHHFSRKFEVHASKLAPGLFRKMQA